jgi:hypothetical protein
VARSSSPASENLHKIRKPHVARPGRAHRKPAGAAGQITPVSGITATPGVGWTLTLDSCERQEKRTLRDVRVVPLTDSCNAAIQILFDYLVGQREQRGRHSDAERLCRLEVDDKLKFGWLLDRQIGGLLSLENSPDVGRRLTK